MISGETYLIKDRRMLQHIIYDRKLERIDTMDIIKERTGKKHSVKVISSTDQKKYISDKDLEMDARAKQAVKAALAKAEFCKKPVAKYDLKTKRVYVEYADGEKKRVK